MNVDEVLRAFLPYHESPNFPRILAILTIPKTSPYYATFAPLIKNAQPIPRSYIVTSISPAKDKSLVLLGDIASMVQQAIKEDVVHHALLTFWTATMVDLLEGARHGKGANEGVVKQLVESFVTLLETPKAGEDVNVSNLWCWYRVEISDLLIAGCRLSSSRSPHSHSSSCRRTFPRHRIFSSYTGYWFQSFTAYAHSSCDSQRPSSLVSWSWRACH